VTIAQDERPALIFGLLYGTLDLFARVSGSHLAAPNYTAPVDICQQL